MAVSRAKSRCADAALLVTRECIKLHGAIGFADECDIGLFLQRALVLSAWLGNAAAHRRRFQQLAPQVPPVRVPVARVIVCLSRRQNLIPWTTTTVVAPPVA